jgi:glucosylceramidase
VRPGARRIESSTGVAGLESVAFRNADDGSLVLIIVNPNTQATRFAVNTGPRRFKAELPSGAVTTFVWRGHAFTVDAQP